MPQQPKKRPKSASKSRTQRPVNRFYHSAKVSEYQFKRVLWSLVLDEPAEKAAKPIDLSANSIQAIYAKLRVFFTEVGIFEDIYEGRDPREGTSKGEDFEGFEYRLIPFHVARIKAKRRVPPTSLDAVDYHWNESYWRFHYSVLSEARPSDSIHRMMFTHLLAFVRRCGPIGLPPRDLDVAARLKRDQFEQRLLWLERSSVAFRSAETRTELRLIRQDDLRIEPYKSVKNQD